MRVVRSKDYGFKSRNIDGLCGSEPMKHTVGDYSSTGEKVMDQLTLPEINVQNAIQSST